VTLSRSAAVIFSLAAIIVLTALAAVAAPYGINAHIPDRLALDDTVEAGIRWIRIDFIWAIVEPSQDVFDWALYDEVVAEAAERDLRIMATIGYSPGWATDGDEIIGPPRDPADWLDVCYRAAARYRGRIHAWELWNEPNLDHFWAGTRAGYIEQIMLPGAEVIRVADPAALVAAPGLAHLSSGHWEDWLEECVSAGRETLDVVTHHAYPSNGTADDVTKKLEDDQRWPWEPRSVREVLQSAGWWGRPVWLGETGVRSTRSGEAAQATFYTKLLWDWYHQFSNRHWLDRIFFYQLHDDPRFPDESFGILGPTPELERKLAFDAYRGFVRTFLVDGAEGAGVSASPLLGSEIDVPVRVGMLNTGTSAWFDDKGMYLDLVSYPEGFEVSGTEFPPDVIVVPGDRIVFEVTIRTPPWYLHSGLTPTTYTLEWRMADSDGNRFGDPLRHRVTVSQEEAPKFHTQPGNHVVSTGGDVRLEVVVLSPSEVEYQWQLNGQDLVDGARFVGALTPTLDASDLDRSMAGEYRCVITNAAGSVPSDRGAVYLQEGNQRSPRNSNRRAERARLLADVISRRMISRDLARRPEMRSTPQVR